MLTSSLRASISHPRRATAGQPAASDPQPLCDRRHEVLVASHRGAPPSGWSFWQRWFQERLQPGGKVY